jgi:hypothetical protein
MQARDRFGNATAWKRWQTLSVAASGPQEVTFSERESTVDTTVDTTASRGTFVATLSRAGAYVVWCTVGGQAVAGWPKVIQVVPGVVDSDAAVWRAEADTAAMTSELVGSSSAVDRHGTVQIVRPREVLGMQREADSLRERLAKYEEAAAVVMEAAEASGVDLKRAARDAAFRAEAEAGGSGSRSTAKRP